MVAHPERREERDRGRAGPLDLDVPKSRSLPSRSIVSIPMITSFRCRDTERLYRRRESVRRFRAFERSARETLRMLDVADSLRVLAAVPGNRLERLKGDRKGQYSIRINRQWRVCFRWQDGDAEDVEIVDYHS